MRKRKENLQELNTEIMQELYEQYIYFVVKIAEYYVYACNCSNLGIQDLIQEGFLGLFRAWEIFDKTQGYKFLTFGARSVKGYMLNAIKEKEPLIPVARYLLADIKKYPKNKKELLEKLGHEPTVEEIAKRMSLSLVRTETTKRFLSSKKINIISLLSYSGEKEESEWILPAKPTSQLNSIEIGEIKDLLKKKLTEQEQMVVIHNFGLFGNLPLSLKEIGDILGKTRERARQIFEKAIKKLKSSES